MTVKVSVQNCARCGQDHDDLEFEPLARPIYDSDGEWLYWAKCPTNGEPVLMRMIGEVEL